ncbi:MAG: hypothetical protein MUO52_06035, partial [Desulfobacterales bacterium]|nr:hypothetical protein [Desulfobacterales bacterium]
GNVKLWESPGKAGGLLWINYDRYAQRPAILRFWERQMIEKHLKRLCAMKVVEERNGRFHKTRNPYPIPQGIDLPGR